ncbi:hypothetical protein [Caldilinea sp.]|uniref:InlB B-repeat-containing protein n=1 Tax=Caldilinea sp. TaxID=2293560 RepID=UPI0031CCC455
MVTLTASQTTGSTFTGWSGACTGTGACIISMVIDQNVTATFAAPRSTFAAPRLTFAALHAAPRSIRMNSQGSTTKSAISLSQSLISQSPNLPFTAALPPRSARRR